MIYKTAVAMRRDQFERVNRLLKIRSLMDMTEEQFQRIGAKANESSLLYTAFFSNGVIIELHLISDSMLYVTIPKYVLTCSQFFHLNIPSFVTPLFHHQELKSFLNHLQRFLLPFY